MLRLLFLNICATIYLGILYFTAPDVTYLNLSVEGNKEITSSAGFRRVQWIVKVSAFPKPSLIW